MRAPHNLTGGEQLASGNWSGLKWCGGLSPRVVAVIGLFWLALLPLASSFITHHPDERHYTDAAIEMVRRGDFLTPYTAAGEVRLNKPILSYWVTAASYQVLGIHPLSSRLPFLLAGGALIGVSVCLARRLGLAEREQFLLALIMATNPSVLISAPRSIPDIFLALALTLGTLGFVGLMRRASRIEDLLLAYGGVTLAILAKGLPGLVFGIYALGFLVAHPEARGRQRWTLHAVALTIGGLLACSWFAAMWLRHGNYLFEAFFHDQVQARLARSTVQGLRQLAAIFGLLALSFSPWLLALLRSQGLKRIAQWQPIDGPPRLFLAGWIGIWIVLNSQVDRANFRYLLPIVPLVGAFAATLWSEANTTRLAIALRPIWRLTCGLLVVAVPLGATMLLACHQTLLAGGVAALGCVGTTWLARGARDAAAEQVAARSVVAALATIALVCIALRPILLPDTGARVAAELQRLPLPERPDRVVLVGEAAIAARTRVFLAGALPLDQQPHYGPHTCRPGDTLVMLNGPLPGPEWTPIATFPHGLPQPHWEDLLRAAAHGELAELLARQRRHAIIGVWTGQTVAGLD